MFSLLLRFWPRKSAGTPNARAPAARELVLMNARRSTRESKRISGFVISKQWVGTFSFMQKHTRAINKLSALDSVQRIETWNKPPSLTMIPAHGQHSKRSLRIKS
jgi:hypothetical protein